MDITHNFLELLLIHILSDLEEFNLQIDKEKTFIWKFAPIP